MEAFFTKNEINTMLQLKLVGGRTLEILAG